MLRMFLFFNLFLLTHLLAKSQNKTLNISENSQEIPFGVYYYPEQWDRSEWDLDLKKMSELGFSFTHFAEFSWAVLEPEEGKYDFAWLDEAIKLAEKNNLKVILCTPTPAPPAWLSSKHPEILVQNTEGIQMQHGSRQHASWSSDVYRSYVIKIVSELAKRYGKDKRIIGWQLDNEPSHYGIIYDYSSAVKEKFQLWLKKKYVSIDSLNKKWGNSFWSQNYNSFDQVRIPNQKELVQSANPHALLDFEEFTNQQRGDFLRIQTEILRKNILPEQFVTTNYMMQLPHIDPWASAHDLDFASYTNYPVNSYSAIDRGPLGVRLGGGRDLSFAHEFFESVNGYTGVMELQPGQVNWGQYNTQPLPGAVRMWIWHTVGLGTKFVCTYRFKQPLFGNEQYHQGIIATDGVSLSRGGEEFAKAIKEIKSFEKELKQNKQEKKNTQSVAILFDQRSQLDMNNFPHTNRWDAAGHLINYYTLLKSFGLNVVFVNKATGLDPGKYPVLIAPSIQLVNDTMINAWNDYVKKGGHLVLTCRTGQKDRDGHLWKLPFQSKISSLIGADIAFNDQLPEGKSGTIKMDGKDFYWSVWADVINVPQNKKDKTTVLATYEDQFYSGKAAAIRKSEGKGSVTYIGAVSIDNGLEKEILKKVFQETSMPLMDLPANVFIEERNGYKIAVNYSSSDFVLPMSSKASVFLGDKVLKPGDVTIWKE